MGIDESEASRLLRGDVPADDPVWGEVSSFLDTVGAAYPTVPTTDIEDRHLAAIAHETRLVHSAPRRSRRGAVRQLFHGSRRILVGSLGALAIALTAGLGVASALGINPLGQFFSPRPVASSGAPQGSSPNAASSDPAGGKGDESSTASPEVVPGSGPTSTPLPTPTALPTPSPTASKTPGSVGDEHKNPRATEKASNAATPKSHATKTPKPPKATPSPPGKGKANG